jgi:outer membrane protein TolC
MTTTMGRACARGAGLLLILTAADAAYAQAQRLTLDEALRLAEQKSETVAIARAGEVRADADLQRARSQRLPQISATAGYDRTLASEFSAAQDAFAPACPPLSVDPSQPVADRVAELERALQCGGIGAGFNFAELPFGQRNVYRYNLSLGQTLYSWGRIPAQLAQAELGAQSAALGTAAARAVLALDVTRAYFDAALSDRVVAIAQLGFEQAAAAYDQARLSFEAGRVPEFEVLRAQVTRDNQRPVVIRRQSERELAYLRLRQLLDLPASATVQLDVDLDAADLAPPAPFADALAPAPPASAAAAHVSVRQAETAVRIREAGVTLAHAERRPSFSVSSSFGQVGYPSGGALPSPGDFRTNWTLGASMQVPIFQGFRLRANEVAARADLTEAEARLQQTREIAELDAASARQELTAAEAVWRASEGTVQQAERAYEIASLRYREGISTQLELSDARLALQNAQANRAQAARDVQVARARVALLPNLPVGAR